MENKIIDMIKNEIHSINHYKELYDLEQDSNMKMKIKEMHDQEVHHKNSLMQMYNISEEQFKKESIMRIKHEMSELLKEIDNLT